MATSLNCSNCSKNIDSEYVKLEGDRNYHPGCFTCAECKTSLGGLLYFEMENELYCEDDYHKKFSPSCGGCHETIKDEYIEVSGLNFHKKCFCCHECKNPFTDLQFYRYNGDPYCDECYKKKASQCFACKKAILGKTYSALGRTYHIDCFVCAVCEKQFEGGNFVPHNDQAYHQECYKSKFGKNCDYCSKDIAGEYYTIQDKNIHKDCYESFKALSPDEQKKLVAAKTEGTKTTSTSTSTTTEEKKEDKSTVKVEMGVQTEPVLRTTVVASSKLEEGLKTSDSASPAGTVYAYELLQTTPFPKGVDPTKREQYLSHSEFERLFNMKYADFTGMPKWKQNEAKKKLKLF